MDSFLKKASFIRRLFAGLIDIAVLYIPIAFITLLILTFDPNSNYWVNTVELNQYMYTGSYIPQLISCSLFVLVTVVFWFTLGSTLGQLILRIKVTDNKGGNLSFTQAFFRSFIYIISLLMVVPHIISVLMVLIRKDNKSLHDMIAKTNVVAINP